MNRRGFLRSVAQAAAAGLILPEIASELILPERTIFLPPSRGWVWKGIVIAPEVYEILALRIASVKRDIELQLVETAHVAWRRS